MDKFGIFNLINSMFDFYKNDYSKNSGENKNNSSNNDSGNIFSSLTDIFSSKEKNNSKNEDEKQQFQHTNLDTKTIDANNYVPNSMRQNQIIYAIKSHTEFVNRVKKNNKK